MIGATKSCQPTVATFAHETPFGKSKGSSLCFQPSLLAGSKCCPLASLSFPPPANQPGSCPRSQGPKTTQGRTSGARWFRLRALLSKITP